MSIDNEEIAYIANLIETTTKYCKYTDDCDFLFPIQEIAGVKCKCTIRLMHKIISSTIDKVDDTVDDPNTRYILSIDNYNDVIAYQEHISHQMYRYENASLTNVLEHFVDVIPKLRLSIDGELSVDTKKDKLLEILMKLPNIKTIYDECCVCSNYTKTTTNCNHRLCYQCWTKLPVKCEDDEDDYAYYQECPMCREVFPC